MFKIQLMNKIAAAGLNQFPLESYEVASEIQHPDAILVRSSNMHDMTFASTLKVVGRAGAGVNNVPVPALTQLGIPVLNTPGANANAVRELVIGGMLLASRNIYQAWEYLKELKNQPDLEHRIEQDKKKFVGFELMGKTLGIIGLGSVGVKVANAALNLGMNVIGFDPQITVERAWELSSDVKQAHNLDDLLMAADFVSIHVPLNEETKNMINHSRLHSMKKNVVILNFARESVIEQQALEEGLKEKKIFAYVTDFPTATLQNYSNVICLPHLGASTLEAEENCAIMIVKHVRDFLEKGAIKNSVNFPSIEMPLSSDATRIAIVNLNVPNMVAQISAKLAEAGLNIVSLLNKSRENIAYTLIDVNKKVNATILSQIADIHGVVQVRQVSSMSIERGS